jgi:hypothetical protein
MDNSWDNYDPAPIEFLHGELMNLFHQHRNEAHAGRLTIPMDGITLGNLIALAKKTTYAKYPGEEKARPKQK